MIELPTPETDSVAEKNIYGVACSVDVDFARKLERERDEARADAAQLADRLSGLELRTTEELARLERERNEWSAMCGRYKQERDEVREQNAKLREIADAFAVALERLDALYRSEQEPEAPMPRPDWLRRPLQMLDSELDRLKEDAK
jgi:chromosome segregation ATPase